MPSAEHAASSDYPAQHLFIALPMETETPANISIVWKNGPVGGSSVPEGAVTVKGFVWIGQYRTLHIEVRPVVVSPVNGTEREIERLSLEFIVPPNRPSSIGTESRESPVIDNPTYGSQWTVRRMPESGIQHDGWIDYSSEYVKLGVAADGIYRLRYSDLQQYGVPVGTINPKALKMYLKGKEIPIRVTGEADGQFHHDDVVEFVGRRNYGDPRYREAAPYGSSYYEYLDRYSDTTIYWLRWTGADGKRIVQHSDGPAPPNDTIRHYDRLMRVERDYHWDFSLEGDEIRRNFPELLENERWGEGGFGVGSVSVSFDVTDRFPGRPARAFMKLQDYASSITTNAHKVALSINQGAVRYDSGYINKYQVKTLTAAFHSTLLQNGINTVDLHSYATASTVNSVHRDWWELEYPRYLRVLSDSLTFGYTMLESPRRAVVAVTGLTTPSVSLYKFRSSDSLVSLVSTVTVSNDTLYFADSVTNDITYFLQKESTARAPIFFTKKKFVNLRESSRSAQYLAITHPVFLSSAAQYVSFIASAYSVSTAVINVEDIYDEFFYGFFSPEPIREFLKMTHSRWQLPSPKHVVLIGKGTYDFYGNKSKYFAAPRVINFVPSWGNPVSDNWFVLWDSTEAYIPQMNIGRIPARTVEEFQSYAVKHQKYVAKGFDDWNKRYLFFSGGNFTDPNQIAQSKSVNDFIITQYVEPPPVGGRAMNFYKTNDPVTNFGPYAPDVVQSSIDNGAVFISYIGHSGTQTWDNSITDISQLANNRDRHPMISDFGCSTAKFAEPDILSFSELAVNSANGQAIAYIGNSSLGFTTTAFTFPQIFYKRLLTDSSVSLGDAHRRAKIDFIKQFGTANSHGLFIKTNTLIGDPIVRLQVPQKPNLSLAVESPSVSHLPVTDRQDSVTLVVPVYNIGTVTNDTVVVSVRTVYRGAENYARHFRLPMPSFRESLTVAVPVLQQPGEHTVFISIDSVNVIDEISETDNSVSLSVIVATTAVRNLSEYQTVNGTTGTISFLNPSIVPTSSSFTFTVSDNPQFQNAVTRQVAYDTFATAVAIDPEFSGKRIWVKAKQSDASPEGLAFSYRVGSPLTAVFDDSTAFRTTTMSGTVYDHSGVRLDSARTTFGVISGGFNDGITAVITRNGQNYVPENTLRGHHVVLFEAGSFAFHSYRRFDIFASASVAAQYVSFLDTLNDQYIVAIGIADEGSQNLTAELRSALKNFGSRWIDSVRFRSSWGIIGRKGSSPGSVPEMVSHPFGGRISIDTTIISPTTDGVLTTPVLGPAAEWTVLRVNKQTPANSLLSIGVVGITAEDQRDTLFVHTALDSVVSLASVNASQYPFLQLFARLQSGPGNISPRVTSLGVHHRSLAELGVNSQTMSVYKILPAGEEILLQPNDTVFQGEKVRITYRIDNAGGVTAKKIPLAITSLWDNNAKEQIAERVIDSIPPGKQFRSSAEYATTLGSGRRTLRMTIDGDSSVAERWKDNNSYSFPFIVRPRSGNPLLPNVFILSSGIRSEPAVITDETDTARFHIAYGNSGALTNDSVAIHIRHFYQGNLSGSWVVRRKYPATADTVSLSIPIGARAGNHHLTVELDYTGTITEFSETDNMASFYFTVATTDFKMMTPVALNVAPVTAMIFLNPTAPSIGTETVRLELDTVSGFSAPLTFTVPLRGLTSVFSVPGLQPQQRYFWRVKILQRPRDWTSGSFYSGGATTALVGSSDSLSWSAGSFIRAEYRPSTGAVIVDSKYRLSTYSAGTADGNTGRIERNGSNVIAPVFGRGFAIAVFDSTDLTLLSIRRFDVSADSSLADSLSAYITGISAGNIVAAVVIEDGANNLTAAARNAFRSIGSGKIDLLSYGDSWSIIGRKGAAPGSVPEEWKSSSSGAAVADTTFLRPETDAIISTPSFGPFSGLNMLHVEHLIPAGAHNTVHFVGETDEGTKDTLITAVDQQQISLAPVDVKKYPKGRVIFHLQRSTAVRAMQRNSAASTPSVQRWTISARPSTELAFPNNGVSIDDDNVMEGEPLRVHASIINVSSVEAESVRVRVKTTTSGIDNIIQDRYFSALPPGDTVRISVEMNTRGKKGSHSVTVEIDPERRQSEYSRSNNVVTIPYTIAGDSIRPTLLMTVDGAPFLDGEFVARQPEILIRYADNNPAQLLSTDTSQFRIELNRERVYFSPGTLELSVSSSPGEATLRWMPVLPEGRSDVVISAGDISGNGADTIAVMMNVTSDFSLQKVFSLPNPFRTATAFTFVISGPEDPDDVVVKIYTVAGRLIKEITSHGKVGFNRIDWDGTDNDGDAIANGVYFYKVIVRSSGKQTEGLSKIVKMR